MSPVGGGFGSVNEDALRHLRSALFPECVRARGSFRRLINSFTDIFVVGKSHRLPRRSARDRAGPDVTPIQLLGGLEEVTNGSRTDYSRPRAGELHDRRAASFLTPAGEFLAQRYSGLLALSLLIMYGVRRKATAAL